MARYSTSDKTKEALIDAAGTLALEKGIDNISTREVAKRAGENIGSIHYHFQGKEGLLEAVLDKATEIKRLKPLKEILNDYNDRIKDPKVQSRALIASIDWSMAPLYDDRPRWCCRIISQILQSTSSLRDKLFRDLLDPSFDTFKDLLMKIDPNLSPTDAFCEFMVICSPIYIYSDHRENLDDKLGPDFDEESYLKRLRESIIRRSLCYFKLPEIERGE